MKNVLTIASYPFNIFDERNSIEQKTMKDKDSCLTIC